MIPEGVSGPAGRVRGGATVPEFSGKPAARPVRLTGMRNSVRAAAGLEPTAVYAPRYVSFDRPYLLLVTDISSGEPLFMARVANPSVP
jgi:hypothetical protein